MPEATVDHIDSETEPSTNRCELHKTLHRPQVESCIKQCELQSNGTSHTVANLETHGFEITTTKPGRAEPCINPILYAWPEPQGIENKTNQIMYKPNPHFFFCSKIMSQSSDEPCVESHLFLSQYWRVAPEEKSTRKFDRALRKPFISLCRTSHALQEPSFPYGQPRGTADQAL